MDIRIKGPTTAFDVLCKVADIIKDDPLAIDMCAWHTEAVGWRACRSRKWGKASACGSVGCICGWAGAIMGFAPEESRAWHAGAPIAKALGLSETQVRRLFLPDELTAGSLARDEIGPKAHAEATACHLANFIAENEEQLKATKIELPSGTV